MQSHQANLQNAIKQLESDDILAKGNVVLKEKKDKEEAKGDAKPKAAVVSVN